MSVTFIGFDVHFFFHFERECEDGMLELGLSFFGYFLSPTMVLHCFRFPVRTNIQIRATKLPESSKLVLRHFNKDTMLWEMTKTCASIFVNLFS